MMAITVDRISLQVCRERRAMLPISDTLSFVEDPDFLKEATDFGLNDESLQELECVLTVFPLYGGVVPVSRHIRDLRCMTDDGRAFFVRYAFLQPSTVLWLTLYPGADSQPLTQNEAEEADDYVEAQERYFSSSYTQ